MNRNCFGTLWILFIAACILCVSAIRIKAANRPAAMYEVGEIINDEYRVYATDNSHTLWITDFEGCTYKAEVSFKMYLQMSYWERIDVSPKEIAEFEITEISKSEMNCNNGGKD